MMQVGLGYRREMSDWDMSTVKADFYEVAPENWLRRDRTPLHRLRRAGCPVFLHGVSLNLGGYSAFDPAFLHDLRALMDELQTSLYSDHLAASGDAHQLYDLFPIPLTQAEVRRVGDRIQQVQDALGCRIAVENTTWYTNTGDMGEVEFINAVLRHADCHILLDINNITVNRKNHDSKDIEAFVSQLDTARVTYLHVAGHEFDERFGMYIDTHSQPVERLTAHAAQHYQAKHGWPILLEWDNDVPDAVILNRELACLRSTTT